MRIAVTGKNGQVVRSLLALADDKTEVIALGRPELDLACPTTIDVILSTINPDVIISAAAYTAVDQAEYDERNAFSINETGAGAVSLAAARIGIPIIHFSTDYVFDGNKTGEYSEDDIPNPINIYGASKLAGERLVATLNPKYLIIRTAWVYSPFGKNFVKTILSLAQKNQELNVVADQWGNPTSAMDLANAILHVSNCICRDDFREWGIYHLVGTGAINRSGFARHIVNIGKQYSPLIGVVNDVNTSDFETKIIRPMNSQLSNKKFINTFNWEMPRWEKSTSSVVEKIFIT